MSQDAVQTLIDAVQELIQTQEANESIGTSEVNKVSRETTSTTEGDNDNKNIVVLSANEYDSKRGMEKSHQNNVLGVQAKESTNQSIMLLYQK